MEKALTPTEAAQALERCIDMRCKGCPVGFSMGCAAWLKKRASEILYALAAGPQQKKDEGGDGTDDGLRL